MDDSTKEVGRRPDGWSGYEYPLGLCLAISSCFFIGSSFIIKKKGLIRLSEEGRVRAAAGGFGYLKEWIWWLGLITMGLGELCNFAAYAFAPASMVTPLGALSVLITAVLASKYLNEQLNLLAKLGCVLCIAGSVTTVIHAPKQEEVTDTEGLKAMLSDSAFVTYVVFVVFASTVLILCYAPKYGNSNVFIYVTICSLIGSISVMCCKGLGLLISQAVAGAQPAFPTLFWIFLFSTVFTISTQVNYLNKALDVFDTCVVTPVYYVMFTTFVITASSILFKEWPHNAEDFLGIVSGFITIIVGIFLINAFKEMNISLELIRIHWIQNKANKAKSYPLDTTLYSQL